MLPVSTIILINSVVSYSSTYQSLFAIFYNHVFRKKICDS